MLHSPANILMEYYIAKGLVSRPSTVAVWPAYWNLMPDQPNELVAFNDTNGTTQGRLMLGPTIVKEGIQIRVRGMTAATGDPKARVLFSELDNIKMNQVTIGSKNYLLHSSHKSGTVIPMGAEMGNQRMNFAINLLLTITEITL